MSMEHVYLKLITSGGQKNIDKLHKICIENLK